MDHPKEWTSDLPKFSNLTRLCQDRKTAVKEFNQQFFHTTANKCKASNMQKEGKKECQICSKFKGEVDMNSTCSFNWVKMTSAALDWFRTQNFANPSVPGLLRTFKPMCMSGCICKPKVSVKRKLSTNTMHNIESLVDIRSWCSCEIERRQYFHEQLLVQLKIETWRNLPSLTCFCKFSNNLSFTCF